MEGQAPTGGGMRESSRKFVPEWVLSFGRALGLSDSSFLRSRSLALKHDAIPIFILHNI